MIVIIDTNLNRAKHRKNQKSIDLSSISNSFIGGSGEEIVVENKQPTDNTNNFYLHQKICDVRFEYEYLVREKFELKILNQSCLISIIIRLLKFQKRI